MEPIEWLTLALVLTTAFYAWQTQQTVREMRESRRLSVLPDLRADMHITSPNVVSFSLTNTGQGPAIDVDVKLIYRAARSVAGTTNERTWKTYTIAPGERHEFWPPRVDAEHRTKIDELIANYHEFEVVGVMKDSLGRTHEVDLKLDKFREFRDIQLESGHAAATDPMTRLAASASAMSFSIQRVATHLYGVRNAAERAYPPPPSSAPEPEDVPF